MYCQRIFSQFLNFMYNHTECFLSCLIFFKFQTVFEIHSWCCLWQHCIHFYYYRVFLWIITWPCIDPFNLWQRFEFVARSWLLQTQWCKLPSWWLLEQIFITFFVCLILSDIFIFLMVCCTSMSQVTHLKLIHSPFLLYM